MGKAVAIIGTGQTKHGRRSDVCYPDLVREAVTAALEDAGITLKDIDGVVLGTMPSMMEGVSSTHFYFAEAMGALRKPVLKVETCGSTGQSIGHCGFYWVASGMADIVLVVGSEKMSEGDGQATMTTVFDPFFQRTFAAGAPGVFTMQSMEWMYRFKIPEEKGREAAAMISVSNHDNAMDNPHAHIRTRVTMDDVKNARIITYPVRLLDVCPASDGACAVIFASQEMAKKICKKPAWIKGLGFRGEEFFYGESDKAVWMSATEAAKEAYQQAGIRESPEATGRGGGLQSLYLSRDDLLRVLWILSPRRGAGLCFKGHLQEGRPAPLLPLGRHTLHQPHRRHGADPACGGGAPGDRQGRRPAGGRREAGPLACHGRRGPVQRRDHCRIETVKGG